MGPPEGPGAFDPGLRCSSLTYFSSMLALRVMRRRQPEVPRGSGPRAKIPSAKLSILFLASSLGTGPGHDAVYLAQKGFRVIAVDVAPGAVELAKSNARQAGVQGKIEFRVQDILKLDLPSDSVSLIIDRGCFHTLAPDARGSYIEIVRKMLMAGKNLFLKTFSDKEPPGPGPYRFSRQELEKYFSPKFDFIEVRESIFDGKYKPKAYVCLLEAKS